MYSLPNYTLAYPSVYYVIDETLFMDLYNKVIRYSNLIYFLLPIPIHYTSII